MILIILIIIILEKVILLLLIWISKLSEIAIKVVKYKLNGGIMLCGLQSSRLLCLDHRCMVIKSQVQVHIVLLIILVTVREIT